MRATCLVTVVFVWVMASSLHAADYHVSPGGRDDGDGTAAHPFRTLGRASEQLQAGDRCILHAGIYRETLRPVRSGQADHPITYLAATGEQITISGADPVSGSWHRAPGKPASIGLAGPVAQVFAGGKMMPEARWPNCTPEQIMEYPRATAGQGTGYDELADPHLPGGDATGGIVLIWNGDRWWSSTRRIAGYTAGRSLRFDRTFRPTERDPYHTHDPYEPKSGNPYILFGARSLLDAPGEWYHDGQTLWYIPVAGLDNVEVRRRDLGLDLDGLSYIHVNGIHFFAAAASLKDSLHCTIEDCHFRYMEHVRELASASTSGAVVSGRDNEFRHCSFGYSAGPALRLRGENNRLVDSVVFDTDYIGAVDGAISAGESVGAVISHCTILRTGRDGIQHGNSRRITITYCDISNVDLRNSDAGGIYCWKTDGTGSVIAYNHVHDNTGDMNVGIYIDNFCHDFTVHHNLSWNNTGAGITLNSSAENHVVVNNTLVSNGKPFATFAYTGRPLTQKGTRIINNLCTGSMKIHDPWTFAQGELAPELSHNGKGAIDGRGLPLAGSAAIDAGIAVPGITDGFAGKAPDLGAYEYGGQTWSAGASFAPPDMPKGIRTSIAWSPLPKVTEKAMLTKDLAVWLDASSGATTKTDSTGHVTRWVDQSGRGHDAVPADPTRLPLLTTNGIAGRPAIGSGALHLAKPLPDPSPTTLFVVAGATQAGEQWQRLASAFNGQGNDWTAPNWQVMIPTPDKPAAFPPQVFVYREKEPRSMKNFTLGGTAMGNYHIFTGQLAEILLYTRALSDDEADAITGYLTEKWGLPEP